MRPESYVGITGFETGAQVGAVRAALPADRLLMVGCGMRGHPVNWAPDKWPNRCPSPPRLPEIFLPYRNVLNILHFTPLADCNLYDHMLMAHEVAGPHFHGFQLNTPWPDIEALRLYRIRFSKMVITITLQPDALKAIAWNPEKIAERLEWYCGIANYVIIDSSAGYGQDLDVDFTRRCYEQIAIRLPNVGFIAAGGLCADNVEEKLSGLARDFPLSTDAEGKLRTFPDDHLYVAEAIRYATTTDALLRKCEAHRNPQPVN